MTFKLEQSQHYQGRLSQAQQAWDTAGTEEERTAISQAWEEEKRAYSFYSDSFNSQFRGVEGEGISKELRWDQQQYNLPLIESLSRTYGDKSTEELIDLWMTDQRWMNNNLPNIAIDAARVSSLDKQQKEDFGLQMLTYDQVAATGEGSAPLWEQTKDIVPAIFSDPTTYVGLGTFGLGFAAKGATKELTKEGLKKLFIKPAVKRGIVTGAAEGSAYTTAFDSFKQSMEREVALQEDWDWGRTGNVALFGAVLGGTLGGVLAKGADLLAPRINAYKMDSGYDNVKMVQLLEEVGNDEHKAVSFLESLGFSTDKAQAFVARAKKDEPNFNRYAAENVKRRSDFQQFYGKFGTTHSSILERMGLKGLADDIRETLVDKDMMIASYNRIVDRHKDRVDMSDVGIATRYRTNKPKNTDEAGMFNDLRKANKQRAYRLYNSGVIDKKTFEGFLKNRGYLGRVWNTRRLSTKEGAEAFYKDISEHLGNKSPEEKERVINEIIGSLTGEKAKDIKIPPREAIRFIREAAMKRDREVKRSTHAEHARNIKGIPEHILDKHMLGFESRVKLVNHDIAQRLSFAERFGGNDEKVVKLHNDLVAQGRVEEADAIGEAYGIAAAIPHDGVFGSKVLKARKDTPAAVRVANKINAFETLKMYGAAIPNIPQAYVNGLANVAGSQGLLRGTLNTFKAPMKAIFKDPEMREILKESGILSELEMHKFLTEGLSHVRVFDADLKGPLGVLNEPTKFLRAVGFMGVEKMNRVVAANMGVAHAKYVHKAYNNLAHRPKLNKLQTKKLNKLKREAGELGIDLNVDELSTPMLARAANNFNNAVNFSNKFSDLPTVWHNPYMKLVFKFKSFMFHHGKFLKEKVLKPVINDGEIRPLLAYLAAAGPLGGAMLQLREKLTGKDYQENAEPLEWLTNGIMFAGGAGLLFDLMASLSKNYASTSYAVGQVAGPVAGDVVRLGGIAREAPEKDFEKTFIDTVNTLVPPAKLATQHIKF